MDHDLSGFPRDAWLAATRRVLRGAASDAFGYGDPRGRPELRRALADYLGRVRGVHAPPELVVVCTGFTQGLRLVCEALRGRGATSLAHEDPCMPQYPRLVASTGLAPVPVAVDHHGVAADRLRELGTGGLLATPAHQCPFGATLAPARRAALLRWARDTGGVVIEDDYDGEFRYDRQPVGALQGLDPERVVYAGTASKTIAPGVRLAWLVVPPSLLEPVVEAKRCADHQSPSIDQLVLADMIGSGAFDRHVRRCRLRYRRRRDRLRAAIAEWVPALRLLGVAAGLHAVALLPDGGPGEDEVLAHAASRSVALTGLGEYRHGAPRPAGAAPRGIAIGYASPPEHAFGAALDALTAALAELWPRP